MADAAGHSGSEGSALVVRRLPPQPCTIKKAEEDGNGRKEAESGGENADNRSGVEKRWYYRGTLQKMPAGVGVTEEAQQKTQQFNGADVREEHEAGVSLEGRKAA